MVLLLGSWLGLVPHAVTAAILVLMASRMVDDGTRHMALQVLLRQASMAREQYRLLLANFSVVLLVALVVVFGDMLKGVAVGVLAAMFLFVRAGMRAVVRRVTTAEMRRSLKVRSIADMQVLACQGTQVVIIEAEGADAIMMNCLPGLRKPHKHVPPCMGFMSLRDEGIPAGCQSDLNATLTMMLVQDRKSTRLNSSHS